MGGFRPVNQVALFLRIPPWFITSWKVTPLALLLQPKVMLKSMLPLPPLIFMEPPMDTISLIGRWMVPDRQAQLVPLLAKSPPSYKMMRLLLPIISYPHWTAITTRLWIGLNLTNLEILPIVLMTIPMRMVLKIAKKVSLDRKQTSKIRFKMVVFPPDSLQALFSRIPRW